MRIKRVVIQGFKTFARRTEFIFDPGVTALVGPNGSGKSNIVDAIRWCLGEQSFSLLRSRKTSDVIFSGSDKKSRLNLAEVTITLDNSQGEAPIDYAEIEITRRAYRDGDNEYLLNGQRVRLQDIIDVLAPTGLGKRTYSVIGQGLIDRALSMKATPSRLGRQFVEKCLQLWPIVRSHQPQSQRLSLAGFEVRTDSFWPSRADFHLSSLNFMSK